MAEKILLRGVLWNLDLLGDVSNDEDSIIKEVIRMNPSSGVKYTDIKVVNLVKATIKEGGNCIISALPYSNFCGDVIAEISKLIKDYAKIEYILLNYFSNNYFYRNGEGKNFNERTEDAINKLNNKDEIYELASSLKAWYDEGPNEIDNVLKLSGISSKSLDGFSISYNTSYRQTLITLLPIWLFTEMRALHIFEIGFLATVKGASYV